MTKQQSAQFDLNRRQFAKSAAAIAAALGLANFEVPELFPTAQAGSAPVNWGMIGTGSRSLDLLRPLSTITNGKCVALCDIYRPNLEKGAKTIDGNPTLYDDDYRRLLDRKDIEAVMIVTPLDRHAKMTLAPLDAANHLFSQTTMVY